MRNVPEIQKPLKGQRKPMGGHGFHKSGCKCIACCPTSRKRGIKRSAKNRLGKTRFEAAPRTPLKKTSFFDPSLTGKQADFVAAFCDPKSPTFRAAKRSMLAAGYSKSVSSTGSRQGQPLQSPKVQLSIRKAFEAYGVTSIKLAERVSEGINAMKTEFFSNKGEVTDQREVIDWATRHKFVETALHARGDFPRETGDANVALIIRVGANIATPEQWDAEVKDAIEVKSQPALLAE